MRPCSAFATGERETAVRVSHERAGGKAHLTWRSPPFALLALASRGGANCVRWCASPRPCAAEARHRPPHSARHAHRTPHTCCVRHTRQDTVDVIDLSDNDISKLENFPVLRRVSWLLLANNRIARVADGLADYLPNVTTVVLTGNRLASLAEVDALASLSAMESLSLLQNPVTRRPHYRAYVVWRFPRLRVLDFQRVKRKERAAATKFFASKAGRAFVEEVALGGRGAGAPVEGDEGASGGAGGGGAGASAAASRPPPFTPDEKAAILAAIEATTTPEEFARLEGYLAQAVMPPELRAAAAGGGGTEAPVAAAADGVDAAAAVGGAAGGGAAGNDDSAPEAAAAGLAADGGGAPPAPAAAAGGDDAMETDTAAPST